jgi:predicted outer membrane repeat protein
VSPFRLFTVVPPAGDTVTIQDLTITGARATGFAGGGLIMGGLGNLIIDSVVFSDNQSGQGGAIYYDGGFTSIRNSTLEGNQAPFGGAILGSSFQTDVGMGEVVNSTISGNSATEFGGGIYVGSLGQIQIQSSTIQGNTADTDDAGGDRGGGTYKGAASAAISVADTLYAGNETGASTPVDSQCGGDHSSFGYNLRETAEIGCTGFTTTGDFVNANPMIGSLGANGGPTPTIPLLTGSAAIAAGNPATPGGAFPACPATDQRGLFRGGVAERCDIGSYELNASSTPPGGGGGGTGGGTTTPPATTVTTPVFNLAAAIKKCKKKFPKGKKRKKCIRRAKQRAQG